MPEPCPPDPAVSAGLDRVDEALRAAGVVGRPAPRFRPAAVAAGFALAVVLVAAIASYLGASVAYDRASEHTDRRVAALERDLSERRRVRAGQDAARDAQTRELLTLVCVLLDRAQPRDAAVEAKRRQYGCAAPSPVPSMPR